MSKLKGVRDKLIVSDDLGAQVADILGLPRDTFFFKVYFHADGRIEVHYGYYPTREANEDGKLDSTYKAFKLVPAEDGTLTREELKWQRAP